MTALGLSAKRDALTVAIAELEDMSKSARSERQRTRCLNHALTLRVMRNEVEAAEYAAGAKVQLDSGATANAEAHRYGGTTGADACAADAIRRF